MAVLNQRNVVVEFECVQIIRKRCKTHVMACRCCGRETDFLSLEQAAQLFEAAACDLFRFLKENACHFKTCPAGIVHICLATLLKTMRERSGAASLSPRAASRFAEQTPIGTSRRF